MTNPTPTSQGAPPPDQELPSKKQQEACLELGGGKHGFGKGRRVCVCGKETMDDLEKLFDMAYKWGRAGVVVDHFAPAFQASAKNYTTRLQRESAINALQELHKSLGRYSYRNKLSDPQKLVENHIKALNPVNQEDNT